MALALQLSGAHRPSFLGLLSSGDATRLFPPPQTYTHTLCVSSSFSGEKRTREGRFEHGEGAGLGAGPLSIPDAGGSGPWPEEASQFVNSLPLLQGPGLPEKLGGKGEPSLFQGQKAGLVVVEEGLQKRVP